MALLLEDEGGFKWAEDSKNSEEQKYLECWGNASEVREGSVEGEKETRDIRLLREIPFFYLLYLNAKRSISFLPDLLVSVV